MAFTHTMTRGFSRAGESLSQSNSYTGGLEKNLSEVIPGGSTDLAIVYSLDVSACKSFYMQSTRDMTIETNSGSAADDTIALKANEPYMWAPNYSGAFELATDVTALYVTLAAGADDTLVIRALVDPTP